MRADAREAFIRTAAAITLDTKKTDPRPVTGMIGQKCVGYMTNQYGELIALAAAERGPEFIGPGSYSPRLPNAFSRKSTISANSKRFEFMRPAHRVGTADHTHRPSPSQINHRIRDFPPAPIIPFRSGDLTHPPWSYSVPSYKTIQRRFPAHSFDPYQGTRVFRSVDARELYSRELHDTVDCFYDIPPLNRPKTTLLPIDERPRLPSPESDTPSPDQYEIPSSIGSGRKTDLSETWGKCDTDPPPITPGPGKYNPDAAPAPRDPPRSRYIPPELIPKREPPPREIDPFPEPTQYDPILEPPTKILTEIHERGQKLPWIIDSGTVGPVYNTRPVSRVIGGYIPRARHGDLAELRLMKERDRELAFRSLHGSLIARSPNMRTAQQLAAAAAAD
jgi:hypothetical protein